MIGLVTGGRESSNPEKMAASFTVKRLKCCNMEMEEVRIYFFVYFFWRA
jgi:hypothetical protein